MLSDSKGLNECTISSISLSLSIYLYIYIYTFQNNKFRIVRNPASPVPDPLVALSVAPQFGTRWPASLLLFY